MAEISGREWIVVNESFSTISVAITPRAFSICFSLLLPFRTFLLTHLPSSAVIAHTYQL